MGEFGRNPGEAPRPVIQNWTLSMSARPTGEAANNSQNPNSPRMPPPQMSHYVIRQNAPVVNALAGAAVTLG